jgi:hypothetical protein
MTEYYNYYFTFGQKHPLKDHWVRIVAPNESLARKTMFEIFGDKWAFSYPGDKFPKEAFPKGEIGCLWSDQYFEEGV